MQMAGRQRDKLLVFRPDRTSKVQIELLCRHRSKTRSKGYKVETTAWTVWTGRYRCFDTGSSAGHKSYIEI